jgi:hypothetical protein
MLTDNADFSEYGKAKDNRKGVLLGYWKDSPEQSIADKHAIHGLISRNGPFQLKIVPYTRDGNPVKGICPLGLEVYHDTCVFEPSLEGLTCTEIEEYCRICTEYDIDWAIEVAKTRVAINAKAEGLNSVEFNEKKCILAKHRIKGRGRSAKKKNTRGRLGSKEAQYTATVNSTGDPETAKTMCHNVDDMPSTPLRDILRKRTQRVSPFKSSQESDDGPNEESDEDISAPENANEHQAVRMLTLCRPTRLW